MQTSAVSGRNANWQQTVELKLDRIREANNDFSAITDSLQITVYDRVSFSFG